MITSVDRLYPGFATATADENFPFKFQLPCELEASEPPEARGLQRDQVRLLVSMVQDNQLIHTRFDRLPNLIDPGDVLVINTSATLNAAVQAIRSDGSSLMLHLSTRLPDGKWLVELRKITDHSNETFHKAQEGETLVLPEGGYAHILQPYPSQFFRKRTAESSPKRLWLATLDLPIPDKKYLDKVGSPIRYKHVKEEWPLSYYQTVYANEAGSAEMPSAGRAFTPQIITQLVSKGVQVLPLLLHTGVSSLEKDELPYPEYYRITAETASAINLARSKGKRVIATGTSVVRVLETVTSRQGISSPGQGWTDLVISPQRQLTSIDGLLTGFHIPQASHLSILNALAGIKHIRKAYRVALSNKYLWHEFGDLHLILP